MDRRAWALAVMVGYDTSQRLSDVLAVTWIDDDGEGIRFGRRTKGNNGVWGALFPETIAMIADTPRDGDQIIIDHRGEPISSWTHFNRVFRAIKKKADLPDEIQFHDLRRTAASGIDAGGGNIEPITGHKPGSSAIPHYIVPGKDAAGTARSVRTNREQKSERQSSKDSRPESEKWRPQRDSNPCCRRERPVS